MCANILGQYTLLTCWLCDLHMEYGSHICSVIYAYIELILYIEVYIDSDNII